MNSRIKGKVASRSQAVLGNAVVYEAVLRVRPAPLEAQLRAQRVPKLSLGTRTKLSPYGSKVVQSLCVNIY